MDEIEILRGAKVRVTTHQVVVGGEVTPIAAIVDTVFVEADHSIRLAPKILFVLSPVAGLAVHLVTGWNVRAIVITLFIMAAGAILMRDSWLHQVNVRLSDNTSRTLFRTSRKGDALLFHSAIAKAKELTASAPSP